MSACSAACEFRFPPWHPDSVSILLVLLFGGRIDAVVVRWIVSLAPAALDVFARHVLIDQIACHVHRPGDRVHWPPAGAQRSGARTRRCAPCPRRSSRASARCRGTAGRRNPARRRTPSICPATACMLSWPPVMMKAATLSRISTSLRDRDLVLDAVHPLDHLVVERAGARPSGSASRAGRRPPSARPLRTPGPAGRTRPSA